MDSNKKKGTGFEQEFAEFLAAHGFWAHLLKQNNDGQPADIIASRSGRPVLLDCKACEKGFFRLDRIEENQWNAMSLWKECGNGKGWFALKLPDDSVWLFSMDDMENFSYTTKILGEGDIRRGFPAEEWVKAWT